MATHTPKGASIARFIEHESGSHGPWMVRVVEEPNDSAVMLQAWLDNEVETHPAKSMEVQTSQVNLYDDEIDEKTKTLIREWLGSL